MLWFLILSQAGCSSRAQREKFCKKFHYKDLMLCGSLTQVQSWLTGDIIRSVGARMLKNDKSI